MLGQLTKLVLAIISLAIQRNEHPLAFSSYSVSVFVLEPEYRSHASR